MFLRVGTLKAPLYAFPSISPRPKSGPMLEISGTPMILKSGLAKVGKLWHSKQRVFSDRKTFNPRCSDELRTA